MLVLRKSQNLDNLGRLCYFSDMDISAALDVSTWKVSELNEYVGGLSNPSKMPGFAFSLPAKECKVGSKLRDVKGSTCSGCYAMKGRYVFANVQNALYRRLEAINKPLFVIAMAELINRKNQSHFRWHDSGDLQSVNHFANICEIAELTPNVKHWLPTREYGIVTEYVNNGGNIPENLNVRFSAHMIGGNVPKFPRLANLVTISTVSKDSDYENAYDCPARFQDNNCGDCRACWDKDTFHVDYHLH